MKRDDVAIYVTFILLGVGVGLLVGSYISALREEKGQDDEQTSEKESQAERANPPATVRRRVGRDRAREIGKSPETLREVEGSRKEKGEERKTPTKRELNEVLDELSAVFELTTMDRKMVLAGVITIADLQESLRERQPTNYAKHYGQLPEKPPLEKVVVSEGGKVFEEYPTFAHAYSTLDVIYFTGEDMWARVAEDKRITEIDEPDYLFGADVADEVLTKFNSSGLNTLYVVVDETETVYSIDFVEGSPYDDGFEEV